MADVLHSLHSDVIPEPDHEAAGYDLRAEVDKEHAPAKRVSPAMVFPDKEVQEKEEQVKGEFGLRDVEYPVKNFVVRLEIITTLS